MFRRVTVIAGLVALGLSTGALADNDDHSVCKGEGGWLPNNMIISALEKQGYKVKKLKPEHGCLEADVVGKDGYNYELMVHPASGKVLGKTRE